MNKTIIKFQPFTLSKFERDFLLFFSSWRLLLCPRWQRRALRNNK